VIKEERRARLMEAQQEIALAWSAAQVGKTLEVIVDGPDPEMPNHVQARGHADTPEIDCMVRVKGKNLQAGDIVPVKITAADQYDLVGRAVGAVR
jgi:ribosomal protein S12 methylthiotransferase